VQWKIIVSKWKNDASGFRGAGVAPAALRFART
jgi:hypothetical protein